MTLSLRRPARAAGLLLAAALAGDGLLVLPAAAAPLPDTLAASWSRTGGGVHRSSPTLGDLSVGRVVLHGDMSGYLTATRGDGSTAWRSPVDPRAGSRTAVESSPAVGELVPGGGPEVVVGAGALGFPGQDGGVVAYRGDGSVLWRFRAPDRFVPGDAPDGHGDGVFSSPAIGDVDGDGAADVVFGGWDHNVWALRGSDGSVLPGFPFENTDTVFSSPALADSDLDGVLDIVIGGDQSNNPTVPGSYAGGVLRVLTATGGRVTQRFRVDVPDIVASSPAIGDLDGSGREAAVFIVGNYWSPDDPRRVWAVHLDDGSLLPGWPRPTDAPGFGSVALGDVVPGDGGRPEVVVGDTRGTMYVWRGDGRLAWRTSLGGPGTSLYGGPAIGDLDGDGRQDVAVGYCFGGAVLLQGSTGKVLARTGGPYASEVTPLIADFGGRTGRRLVVGGWLPSVADFRRGSLASFPLPRTAVADAWPMFHDDPRHRGGGRPASLVHGAIATAWRALGGADGLLGRPLTRELPTPARPGRYNVFEHGSIYWSAGSGAHEVHGRIRDAWGALGWEGSLLGFPTADERRVAGGAVSAFQGGRIGWSPATGAHEVHGDIGAAWQRRGGPAGPLGFPRTDEQRTPGRVGAFNAFTGGSVYWSPATGAHAVLEPLKAAWAARGWEAGCLGFPVAEEVASGSGATRVRTQAFQGGAVRWTAATGAVATCR